MTKSISENIAYWDERVRGAADPLDAVLWRGLPAFNRYVDELQMRYLGPIFASIQPHERVLDVGCGVGRLLFRIAPRCAAVVGVDSSPAALETCRETAARKGVTNAHFAVMNAASAVFAPASFDRVMSVTCLMLITDPEALKATLARLVDALKPGGQLILIEKTANRMRKDAVKLSRAGWCDAIEKAGADIESVTGLDLSPLRLPLQYYLFLIRRLPAALRDPLESLAIAMLRPFEVALPGALPALSSYSVLIARRRA